MTKIPLINWWISKKWDAWHLFLGLCGLSVCLTGLLAGFPALSRVGEWGIGMLLFLHMFHAVLHRLDQYLGQTKDVDLVPAKQMKQVTGFYLSLFLMIFVLVAWLGRYLPWGRVGGFVWNLFVIFVRAVIGLFSGTSGREVEEAASKPESGGEFALPYGETSRLAQLLDQLLVVLFWVAAVVFLVWLGYQLIHRTAQWLGSFRFDGDEKCFLNPKEDQIQKLEGRGQGSPMTVLHDRIMRIWDRSVDGRIRAKYRRLVRMRLQMNREGRNTERWTKPGRIKERRRAGQQLEPCMFAAMTPEETELHAGFDKGDPKRQQMHEIYEKARYSEYGCVQEELEKINMQK